MEKIGKAFLCYANDQLFGYFIEDDGKHYRIVGSRISQEIHHCCQKNSLFWDLEFVDGFILKGIQQKMMGDPFSLSTEWDDSVVGKNDTESWLQFEPLICKVEDDARDFCIKYFNQEFNDPIVVVGDMHLRVHL